MLLQSCTLGTVNNRCLPVARSVNCFAWLAQGRKTIAWIKR
jgi:hypothetical protein